MTFPRSAAELLAVRGKGQVLSLTFADKNPFIFLKMGYMGGERIHIR
jgi:hypothetical protein